METLNKTMNYVKNCRLCMSPLSDTSQEIALFDKQGKPHIVVDKLRQFVNLNVELHDKFSAKVCHNCVVNLDFCIQFVDRCRRVSQLVSKNVDQKSIQQELNVHYPYLHGNVISSNTEKKTVPFPQVNL